jgi:hypothetical protein
MKKIFLFLIIASLLVNIGCDSSFLDTKPYHGLASGNIFSNNEYALKALNGAYNSLAQVSFGPYFYVMMSTLGPEGYGRVRGDWGITQAQGLADSRNGQYLNLYRNFYRTIIYANDIISGLEGNENVAADSREIWIAEAKFLRGLCYFYLWNLYGGVVILDKPTAVEDSQLPRNSAEEVVELIISDFTDAIAALPMSNDGRATKGAAVAMLGKTYLYNNRWADAANQFEILLKPPYEYDLVDNFGDNFNFKTQNNIESVFEIQYTMAPGAGSEFNNWYGSRVVGLGPGQDYCEMSQRAFEVYTYADGSSIDLTTIPRISDYPDKVVYGEALISWYETVLEGVDKRLHQSAILPGAYYHGYTGDIYKLYYPISAHRTDNPPALWHTFGDDAIIPIRKYVTEGQDNNFSRTDCPTNYPLIRFADILLMYAEANNELGGPNASVYEAIDKIRLRADLQPLAVLKAGMSKDEMREEIKKERFKEFMFEGILYFDSKRWRVAHTNDPVFGLNYTEVDFRMETEWYKKVFRENRDYLWPIPGSEIDINPLMTQNTGWN